MQKSETNSVNLPRVAEVVKQHYGDEICRAIKAGIAVVACHSLKEREHCLSLNFVGPSGKGKSVSVNVFMPIGPSTKKYLHRVDNFTPASFVSHAANRKKSELASIDLLPRIKDKTMLTKELSPLFRGDLKEMQKNFSILTSVLDGKGYVTESGAQGERGYTEDHLFNWIGATTPFPDHTYRMMGQLGNRMYFYELDGDQLTEDDLMDFARNHRGNAALKECQKAVQEFTEKYFQKHPVNSVKPDSVAIPDDLLRELVRYGNLISYGRIAIDFDDFGNCTAEAPEGPQRIILSLQMIAKGAALANERSDVTDEDMEQIRHIAFSSLPQGRRKLLRVLLVTGGTLTAPEMESALGVSRPTAHKRMKELAATRIAIFTAGNEKESIPAKITLADEWQWLLKGTPLKQSGGVCADNINDSLSTPP